MDENKKKVKYSQQFLAKYYLGNEKKVYITDDEYEGLPTRADAMKIAKRNIDELYDELEYWEEFHEMKQFAQVQELEEALSSGKLRKAGIISDILLRNAHWNKE